MTNLIDFYSGPDGEPVPTLSEMKLGLEPAMAMLFTADIEPTRLHYVADEAVRSYLACPGTGCPLCFCGVEPPTFHLLPVFDVEAGLVKVLRIPARRQPGGLGPLLVPHLRDKDIASKVILLSRNGAKYTIEARPLGTNARRGEAQIKAFLEDQQAGITLAGAFPRMSPEELAEVPAIAAKLDALGGWKPPPEADRERATDAQAPDVDPDES
ncbi:MAG: hypothetical protein ABIP94_11180 [Planctomycetota bacterium]